MKPKALQIKRAISGIEKLYPPDDFIKTYKDFTREREFLPSYQYNGKVFESLVNIAAKVWKGKERINRPSLIEFIKRYGDKNPDKKNLSDETSSQLFELFRIVLTEGNPVIKEETFKEMQQQVNLILKGVKLKEEELQWMIDNLEKSEHFLNRILRQPAKSKVVSEWVKENFLNHSYRERRAELIGRMLDFNSEFEITKELIIEDFEYSLKYDYHALKAYKEDEEASEFLEQELKDVLPEREFISPFSGKLIHAPFASTYTPLKLSKRFYPFAVKEEQGNVKIPDFKKLRTQFYDNLDLTWRISIGWGIAYSHLENSEKSRLLQKSYSEEVYLYYYRIGKQFKIMEFLYWLFNKYR